MMTEAEQKVYDMAKHDCAVALEQMRQAKDELNRVRRESEQRIEKLQNGKMIIADDELYEFIKYKLNRASEITIKFRK